MNEKIKEILLGDPESFELTDYLDSDEQDELEETDDDSNKKDFWEKKLEQLIEENDAKDLVDMVEQQQINYLDLETRKLNLEKLTINDGDY